MSKKIFKSLEQESLLKKFNIFFGMSSVLPLLALFYFVYEYLPNKTLNISDDSLRAIFILANIGTLISFFWLRNFILKFVRLTEIAKGNLLTEGKKDLQYFVNSEGEVGELACVFNEITSQLEENMFILEKAKERLYRILGNIGKSITSLNNLAALTHVVLESIIDAFDLKAGVLFSFNEEENKWLLNSIEGEIDFENIPREIKLTDDFVIKTIKENKLKVYNTCEENVSNLLPPPFIWVPFISKNKLWGIMYLVPKSSSNLTDEDLNFLHKLSFELTVSLENVQLNLRSENTYLETITAFTLALEAKDSYLRGHSEKVMELAVEIGKRLQLSKVDLKILRDSCRLHNIGKITIDNNLLHKNNPLTATERAEIERHPIMGDMILEPLRMFKDLREPIRHHHEFLDGSGYPDGLKGDEIPIITRIITAANIYVALTSDRADRKAFTKDEAKRELLLLERKGKIDSKVTAALLEIIR